MTHAVPTLALLAALAAAAFPASRLGAQDVPEMSPEAITAFAEGIGLYQAADYPAAAQAFARAHELDPSFAVAAFFEGLNWGNAGEAEKAREAYARAAEGRDRMSAYYRYRLAAQMADDRATYREENRKAAAIAPGSKAAYNLARGAASTRMPHEALRALAALDPDRPPMRGWRAYWSVLISAQHQVGDLEGALANAREALRRYPEPQAFYYQVAENLAALGREEELDPVIDALASRHGSLDMFLVTAAAEADAHGHPDLAERLLRRAMAVYDTLQEEDAQSTRVRNWKGIALFALGEMEAAEAVFRGLRDERPSSDAWHAWVALIEGRRGDRAAAEAEIRRLLAKETPEDVGTLSYYAAAVAAGMGDASRFVELMKQAEEAGRLHSEWDHRHPVFQAIRSDPAVQALMRPRG